MLACQVWLKVAESVLEKKLKIKKITEINEIKTDTLKEKLTRALSSGEQTIVMVIICYQYYFIVGSTYNFFGCKINKISHLPVESPIQKNW